MNNCSYSFVHIYLLWSGLLNNSTYRKIVIVSMKCKAIFYNSYEKYHESKDLLENDTLLPLS